MADDSKAGEVGARYALALFDLAKEQGQIPAIEADLKTLKAMIAESRELRGFLASPIYDSETKAKALLALADRAALGALTRKFLGFLAAQHRSAALPAVIARFHALAADFRGVVQAEVTTAVPIDANQAKGLAAALRLALGKDPEIETRVDPAILGGVKVKVGSRLYDASLKSKLDSLKFSLKRA